VNETPTIAPAGEAGRQETPPQSSADRFARLALPHLDAAYNLARWLTRSDADAADVVQESFLRALRAFGGLRGEDVRPWLLAIVRNTCWSWLQGPRGRNLGVPYEAEEHDWPDERSDPEVLAMRAQDRARVDEALAALPFAFREVVVLREMQELSYAEIARVLGLPVGTVMSRLARARGRLAQLLQAEGSN